MMIRRHARLLPAACMAAVLSAGSAADARAGENGAVCTRWAYPVTRVPVQLIATATPDTVRAGVAGMENTARAVYGQVVRVERAGGPEAGKLPAGPHRAVLVPWSTAGSCERLPWTWSARWVEPGERGVYWTSPRPREQWVNGLPTFDIEVGGPYTGRDKWAYPADSMMTVDQFFDFILLLPRAPDAEANPEAAARPMLAWARAHPDLARLHPASDMLAFAGYDLRHKKVRRLRPPLGGTWRFTVSVDGSAPRTFFARTGAAPDGEWITARVVDEEYRPPLGSPIQGYYLGLRIASREDSLPTACCATREWGRRGSMAVLPLPDSVRNGVRFWRGNVGIRLLEAAFPGDTAWRTAARVNDASYGRRYDKGMAEEARAHFVLSPDGSAAMEQVTELDDGRRIIIRGERTSRVTVREEN